MSSPGRACPPGGRAGCRGRRRGSLRRAAGSVRLRGARLQEGMASRRRRNRAAVPASRPSAMTAPSGWCPIGAGPVRPPRRRAVSGRRTRLSQCCRPSCRRRPGNRRAGLDGGRGRRHHPHVGRDRCPRLHAGAADADWLVAADGRGVAAHPEARGHDARPRPQ